MQDDEKPEGINCRGFLAGGDGRWAGHRAAVQDTESHGARGRPMSRYVRQCYRTLSMPPWSAKYRTAIRMCRPRTTLSLIPAYSPNVMSDTQLESIYDYMCVIPEPSTAEDIPPLRDLR